MSSSTAPATGSRGWLLFSTITLIVAGTFNLLGGLSILDNKELIDSSTMLYDDLTFWGWMFTIWGGLQMLAGFMAMGGKSFGFWLGIVLAFVSALLWVFFIWAVPLAAIVGVTLAMLVLYGLTVNTEN